MRRQREEWGGGPPDAKRAFGNANRDLEMDGQHEIDEEAAMEDALVMSHRSTIMDVVEELETRNADAEPWWEEWKEFFPQWRTRPVQLLRDVFPPQSLNFWSGAPDLVFRAIFTVCRLMMQSPFLREYDRFQFFSFTEEHVNRNPGLEDLKAAADFVGCYDWSVKVFAGGTVPLIQARPDQLLAHRLWSALNAALERVRLTPADPGWR